MPLPAVTQAVENIESLMGSVLIKDPSAPTTFVSAGTIGDINVDYKSVEGSADQAGRNKTLALDFEVSFVMLQTTEVEQQLVAAMLKPTGSGHTVLITDEPTTAAQAADAEGVTFSGVLFQAEGARRYRGEQSMITMKFKGRVTITQFETFATTKTIAFA